MAGHYQYSDKCLLCVGKKPHYDTEHEREIARTDRFRATGKTDTQRATELLNPAYAARLWPPESNNERS